MRVSRSMCGKVLRCALAFALSVMCIPVPAFAQAASDGGLLAGGGALLSAEQAGSGALAGSQLEGSGTKESPYLIGSAADLVLMGDLMESSKDAREAHYLLTSDIEVQDFEPIGATSATSFIGYFDGGRHTIAYTMTTSAEGVGGTVVARDRVGLFGVTGETAVQYADAPMEAHIGNLIVKGEITLLGEGDDAARKGGSQGVGGIVGSASYTEFENCLSYVSIKSDNSSVSTQAANPAGGLAGYSMRCTFDGCANLGSVSSVTGKAGGLVGEMASTEISNCYNRGPVTGRWAGGLVGQWNFCYTANLASALENCYTASVVATSYKSPGAIIGCFSNDVSYADQNTVRRTYATDAHGVTSLYGNDTAARAEGLTIDGDTVKVLPDADMRSDGFLKLLSGEFVKGLAYPLLAWEPGEGAPAIVVQPQDATYEFGASAVPLVVEAKLPEAGKRGANGALSYQWYQADTPEAEGVALGGNSPTFMPSTTEQGTSYYRCVVTNAFDGESVSIGSAWARIQVKSLNPAKDIAVVAGVDSCEVSQIASDEAATISVTVSPTSGMGVGSLAYAWEVAAKPEAEGGSFTEVPLSGGELEGDAATFTVPRAKVGTLYYRCVVTNTFAGVAYEWRSGEIAVTVVEPAIASQGDLADVARYVNGGGETASMTFNVTDDFTAIGVAPIGTPEHPFKGVFEGNGHRISVFIDNPGEDYQALIGYAQDATVRDLVVKGSVTGYRNVAGVVAYAAGASRKADGYNLNGTVVENVGNEAQVTSALAGPELEGKALYLKDFGTGGVVGMNEKGLTVTRCYNTGTVSGACHVGGVVGHMMMATSTKCTLTALYNTGTVRVTESGSALAGGIVGSCAGKSDNIPDELTRCYNAGRIELPEGTTSSFYGSICGGFGSYAPDYVKASPNYYATGMTYVGDARVSDGGDGGSALLDGDRGSGYGADATYNKAKSSGELQGAPGVALMNTASAGSDETFKFDENRQNANYPLLSWQPIEDAFHVLYTVTVKPADATYTLTDETGGLNEVLLPLESSVDATGNTATYTYRLLGDSDYSYDVVPASLRDYLPAQGAFATPPLTADAAETASVTLISEKHDAKFKVASDGRALEGAAVRAVHGDTGEAYEANTGSNGAVTLANLLPGTYDYTVRASGFNDEAGTFEVKFGGADVELQVDLVACPKIAFSVKGIAASDDPDDPESPRLVDLDDAVVTITGLTGAMRAGQTSEAASGAAVRLPDGTYSFHVDAVGYDRAEGELEVTDGRFVSVTLAGADVSLAPGDADVLVDVELGLLTPWDGKLEQQPRQDSDGAYLISNAAELAWFAHEVNENHDSNGVSRQDARLIADIALNEGTLVNRWTPIASPSSSDGAVYAGTFDGQGHVVTGIYSIGSNYQGLFGALYKGARIANVVVSGMVSGSNYVGAVAGYADGAVTIENCGSYARVRGATRVGGILGGHERFTNEATVTGCFNKGTVASSVANTASGSSSYTGGIVGDAYNMRVESCYNLGTVSSNGYGTGGIVGIGWGNLTFTDNCYSAGDVVSSFSADYDYYGKAFAAIFGFYAYGMTAQYGAGNYWLSGTAERGVGYSTTMPVTDTSQKVTGAEGLAAKLDAQGPSVAFVEPSDSSFNGGFPRLEWEGETRPDEPVATQDGSEERPWLIEDYDDLVAFAAEVLAGRTYAGEHVALLADIDLVADRGEAEAFSGIGYGEGELSSSSSPFSGIFDGRGHTVSNLAAVPLAPSDSSGFIRNLYGGTVRHLRLEGSCAGSGASFTGGVAGYAYGATISDCDVRMDVGAGTASSGSVGGVAGRAFRASVSTCYFEGALSGGYPANAIAGGLKSYSTFRSNYYRTTAEGVAAFATGDVEGEGEAVSDGLSADDVAELAWKLNTRNGSQFNDGIWSDEAENAGEEALPLCFARATGSESGPHAVFRIYKSTEGTSASIGRAYAHEGDEVAYSDLVAKKGYVLAGGAVVTRVKANAYDEVYGDVLRETDALKTVGSFTMPDADVRFSASATFDATSEFSVTCQVSGIDAGEPAPTVTAEPGTCTAGTVVDVSISGAVPDGKSILSVRAYEDDADAAPVAVRAIGIGSKYRLDMPRADVRVVVNVGAKALHELWPSDEVDFSLKHTYTTNAYYENGNYQAAFVTVDGNAESGISKLSDDVYASSLLLSTSDVEDSTAYQYRSDYSLFDGKTHMVHNYQGLRVYDFLVHYGMAADLPDDTPVVFSNRAGESVELTIADLRSLEYGSFGTDGENAGLKVADGQPVILAYAEDGRTFAMDAVSDSRGTVVGYEKNTPFTLVVGQRGADDAAGYADANAAKMLVGVDSIAIGAPGEVVYGDHHVTDPYAAFAESSLGYTVKAGARELGSGAMSVSGIESLALTDPDAREVRYAAVTQLSNNGVINSLVGESDVYEGVSFATLLDAQGVLDGLDASAIDGATVTFFSDDGYGGAEPGQALTVPLVYLLGGEAGDFVGNVMNAGGLAVSGTRPFVGFAKNGFPLVPYKNDSKGYVDGAYNRFGPLCAVLPCNDAYGVRGDSSVANNSVAVMYLSSFTVDVPTVDISKATVKLSSSELAFNGNKRVPTVKGVSVGGVALASSDYTVKYSNADSTNAGSYTVSVTGKGRYTGTAKASYKIAAKPVKPVVTLAKSSYAYAAGSVRTPGVTVKVGSTTMAKSTYDVTYAKGRVNVGTYSVTVKMKGNYSGSASKSFTIVPQRTAVSKLTPGSKRLTVKWAKRAAQTSGYQLMLATDSKFTANKKTVTVSGASTVSKAVTGLKAAKKYWVKVRTFKTVGGKKYYSDWSAAKAATTKK